VFSTKRISQLKKDIESLFESATTNHIFPGAVLGISFGLSHEKKKLCFFYGKHSYFPDQINTAKETYYDLASLTKPLATTLAVLCLLKKSIVSLNDTLPSLLAGDWDGEKKNITLKQLLSHCSGFPAYRPYYEIAKGLSFQEAKEKIFLQLFKEPLVYHPGSKSEYSDLGFMLLGRIIEEKSGILLNEYVANNVLKPLGLEENLWFGALDGGNKKGIIFAPTENCPWRKKILCGEVHDDNCYVMGGVAGHAGLFGNIEGVLSLTSFLLDQWYGRAAHPNYANKDLASFFARVGGSTWALGFDTPAPTASSGGRYISEKSVGHLGFTGTSFWIDYPRKLSMVLLSNRVHPDRNNNKIKEFRPVLHDSIIKNLYL